MFQDVFVLCIMSFRIKKNKSNEKCPKNDFNEQPKNIHFLLFFFQTGYDTVKSGSVDLTYFQFETDPIFGQT